MIRRPRMATFAAEPAAEGANMDPQAAWNELLDCLAADDLAEAEMRADALITWLDRHGFPPQTSLRVLPSHWDEAICRYLCRKVMLMSTIHEGGQR